MLVFLFFVLCLWSDQSECMALFLVLICEILQLFLIFRSIHKIAKRGY